jgi:polar amino acid transport system substrate-binding protein
MASQDMTGQQKPREVADSMQHLSRPVLAGIAALAAVSLAACGGSPQQDAGGGSPSYGKCKVTGKAGEISLKPVTAGVLTVQTNLPSPGWWSGTSPDTMDGGYEYCLAANIAHRAGLPRVKVVNVSFDALVAGQTKDYDLAMAQVSITDARKQVVQFSAPYYDSNIGVLVKSDANVNQADLRTRQLGAAVGTTAAGFAKDVLKPTKSARIFQDTDSMVTAVASGQVDGALQDTAIMLGFAKQSSGALKVVGQFKTGEQYGAIYPKGSPNAAAMDKAMSAMKSDGTLEGLSSTWLGPAFGGDPSAVPFFTTS